MSFNSNFDYDIIPTYPVNTSGEVYNLETRRISRGEGAQYTKALIFWFIKDDGTLAGKFEEIPNYFLATYLEYTEANRGALLAAFKSGLNTWYPHVTSQKYQALINGPRGGFFNLYNGVFVEPISTFIGEKIYLSNKETNFDDTPAIKAGSSGDDIGSILYEFNFMYKELNGFNVLKFKEVNVYLVWFKN